MKKYDKCKTERNNNNTTPDISALVFFSSAQTITLTVEGYSTNVDVFLVEIMLS